jgi:drug/metabolite transporter (DMT)-like permease
MHPYQMAFFRNFFGLVYFMGWQSRRGFTGLRTTRLRWHLARGVLNGTAMLMFFQGLQITPLAAVAALNFTAPLYASLMAFFILREGGRVRRSIAMAIGFAGALVVLRPGFVEIGQGPLLVLVSSAIWSGALLIIKVLSRTESSVAISTYMVMVTTPITLAAALFVWQLPTLPQLFWLAIVAALGSLTHIAMAQSFKLADATAVLPLDFLKLIWSALLGYGMYGEVPDHWVWIGGLMIFSSSTYVALRERYKV